MNQRLEPGDERQGFPINLQLFVVKERIHQIRIKRKIKIRSLGRVTQKSEMRRLRRSNLELGTGSVKLRIEA